MSIVTECADKNQVNKSLLISKKPKLLSVIAENIPTALKEQCRWVAWRLMFKDGKWTKVPYNAKVNPKHTKKMASSADPDSWTTIDVALSYYQYRPDIDGIGIVLNSDGFVGGDFDHCVNDGEISSVVKQHLSKLDTYAEISPSGTGVRWFAYGSLPSFGRKQTISGTEVYDNVRFLTITGHQIEGVPSTINHRPTEVAEFHKAIFGDTPPVKSILKKDKVSSTAESANPCNLGDKTIIDLIRHAKNGAKFDALFNGPVDHERHSENDQALCGMLSFYTDDFDQIDRIMSASALYRSKWDRSDYKQRTIDSVIADKNRPMHKPCEVRHDDKVHEIITPFDSPSVENRIDPEFEIVDPTFDDDDRPFFKDKTMKDKKDSQTQAEKVRMMLPDLPVEYLKHSGTLCVNVPNGERHDTIRYDSSMFRQWISGELYKQSQKIYNDDNIRSAVENYMCELRNTVIDKPVFRRIGRVNDTLFIDRATKDGQVIVINKDGWTIQQNPKSVYFSRNENMAELPMPVRGGSFDRIKDIVNLSDRDLLLIRGFVLDCFKGRGGYLVLFVNGVQGSAKSTMCRILKRIIDPCHKAELCKLPRATIDLALMADNCAVVAFDNLSHIPDWLSDDLCTLSTGGGMRERKLYGQDEEKIFDFCRPIVFNGIPDFGSRADLLDRSVRITLKEIAEVDRIPDEVVDGIVARIMPELLGSICDLLASGLRHQSETLPKLPRMAQSALWIHRCEFELPESAGRFADAYHANRQELVSMTIEASPVAQVLIQMMEQRKMSEWRGTATALYDDITAEFSRFHSITKQAGFPKSSQSLSTAIKRIEPNLKQCGWDITRVSDGRGSVKQRILVIKSSTKPAMEPDGTMNTD